MNRVIRIAAILAALAAGPAFAAQEADPTFAGNVPAGSERDPFSPSYNGRSESSERAPTDSKPCAQACPCGHHGDTQMGDKHMQEHTKA